MWLSVKLKFFLLILRLTVNLYISLIFCQALTEIFCCRYLNGRQLLVNMTKRIRGPYKNLDCNFCKSPHYLTHPFGPLLDPCQFFKLNFNAWKCFQILIAVIFFCSLLVNILSKKQIMNIFLNIIRDFW